MSNLIVFLYLILTRPKLTVRSGWVPYVFNRFLQCCGFMTFWCGSGSADPCLQLKDPDADPDPVIFIIDLQDTKIKQIFCKTVFCILLFEGTMTSFFKEKKSKRSHKTVEIKVFLTIFA
jgi:hypothetical protein